MNKFMEEQWPMYAGTHGMRTELMDSLSDDDLAFSPGGQNMTLGELCREMGEIEYSYIQSFKTFKQDWAYHNTEAGLTTSVSRLKDWYDQLDADMQTTLAALTDEDFQKPVDRGFSFPLDTQIQIYLQALLIFFGKATIFIRAMGKPLPQKLQDWIG